MSKGKGMTAVRFGLLAKASEKELIEGAASREELIDGALELAFAMEEQGRGKAGGFEGGEDILLYALIYTCESMGIDVMKFGAHFFTITSEIHDYIERKEKEAEEE
jgi:hypothetical protein